MWFARANFLSLLSEFLAHESPMSRPRKPADFGGFGVWVATGMGLGWMRPAPGTWGSLPPVVLALALVLLEVDPRQVDMSVALLGLLFGLGCLAWGGQVEKRLGAKDPGAVVSDEIAGQSLALLWLPWDHDQGHTIATCAIAFFAFRFFDIVKPPPARGWQRIEGGLGILIDDLVAGLYALIATQILVRVLW